MPAESILQQQQTETSMKLIVVHNEVKMPIDSTTVPRVDEQIWVYEGAELLAFRVKGVIHDFKRECIFLTVRKIRTTRR